MECKQISLVLIFAFGFCRVVLGGTWEGTDDFASGISTNWTVHQKYYGSMTVEATNGHASFLVSPFANTEQNALLVWKGTPALNQDWTVQINGHNAANWSANGASQLQLVAGDSNKGEGYVIESYRGNSGVGILTAMSQNSGAGPNTLRQAIWVANTDFILRLIYNSTTGNISAWYNLTGSWVLLDTFNIASFPNALPPADVFTFGVNANTYYGPITEWQIYADNFFLGMLPAVTNQPVSVTNVVGTTANFSAQASGVGLAYQWFKDSLLLANATNATLSLTSVQATNAGNYTVVITNVAGSVTSSVAALTVIFPPSITNQFSSQTVVWGSNATLTIGASGTLPLAYQWRTNGIVFSERTASSITVTNFQSTNEGRYDVVITNMAGSITSASAMLYFLPSNNASRLASSSFVSNRFTLLLLGKAATNYIIQISTNLTTWTPLVTNASGIGIISFTDTNNVDIKRFYRARTP